MHLADQLLSAKVYVPAGIAAAGILGVCAAQIQRVRRDGGGAGEDAGPPAGSGRDIPFMGVMGAFVFAAQMVNFPILPGTSGHLGGGVLLAILFGPFQASILMASILTVQCLLFQDGGLLALGANIVNLGIVPAFVGAAIFRLLFAGRIAGRRTAAGAAAWVGVMAGALLVPFEVALSGVVGIPFHVFFGAMALIHAAIGVVEGLITAAVLEILWRVYPRRALDAAPLSRPAALAVLLGGALAVGGGLSTLAAEEPDGLEKAVVVAAGGPLPGEEDPAPLRAPMPDYEVPGLRGNLSAALAGLIGTAGCFLVVLLIGRVAGRKR